MNELAFHFYTTENHAHYYLLYMHAYGTEMEQLAWMVQRHLDGEERNENVTVFLAATVYVVVQ